MTNTKLATIMIILLSATVAVVPIALFNFGAGSPKVSHHTSSPFSLPPKKGSPSTLSSIGFYTCSATSPCPMGIVDYGTNRKLTYSYEASSFVSWANFTKLQMGPSSIGCISYQTNCMTLQQNLVAYNVYEQGSSGGPVAGEYWIQNVAFIALSGSNLVINQLDNIWNFSAPNAMLSGTIYPNLSGVCAQGYYGGQPQFWYCFGPQQLWMTVPFQIKLTTTIGVLQSGSHTGSSYVTFQMAAYENGKLIWTDTFDEVAFNGLAPSSPYFYVSGKTMNPFGSFNDAETVFAGPGGGTSINVTLIRANLTEAYTALGSSILSRIPHAWSAGSDTAEAAFGIKMLRPTVGVGKATHGIDNNNQLW
ncbi:MAG: thermopsin [Thaumarchaeota archaeon]|nr:thermopsin [Nitrososphaerota archaeon]